MSGSYMFVLHLIAFGILSTTIFAGWILHRKVASEKDLNLKVYTAGLLRTVGLLSPVAALLLLVTGIANLYSRYYGATLQWYQESWMIVKIILFAIMLVNGSILGPALSRRRTELLKIVAGGEEREESADMIRYYSRQLDWYYIVQLLLLLGIVYFSAFGSSKHPGFF